MIQLLFKNKEQMLEFMLTFVPFTFTCNPKKLELLLSEKVYNRELIEGLHQSYLL
jgi:hypothetical protein